MNLKLYRETSCPVCGRTETVHRVNRSRILRILRPLSCKMQCRMCLTEFMVHRKAQNQSRRGGYATF
jgi:hypothetical protein